MNTQANNEKKNIRGHAYVVVSADVQEHEADKSETEMDKRASQAVKVAVEKAKICNKPVARYDAVRKMPYLEYADGRKKYAE